MNFSANELFGSPSYVGRYQTMTDVYTVALLPTKPSSDDDSGFRPMPFRESIITTNPECPSSNSQYHQILLDWRHSGIAISMLMHKEPFLGSFLCISSCPIKSKISLEYGGWVGNETSASDLDRKYVDYPAISDTLFSQIIEFFQLRLMCPVEIFLQRDC